MTERTAYNALPDPEYQAEFYADVPFKRFVAWIIDTVIVVGFLLLVFVATLGIGLIFAGFLFFVLGFVYRVVTLANGSATWGMRVMSIEIRTLQGDRLDPGLATMHTLGYYVSMAFFILQIVSFVMMLTTPRGQGLSDMVLGTTALNKGARH
ncbi:MAG: RDD family protein [Maritimibacter sp.]